MKQIIFINSEQRRETIKVLPFLQSYMPAAGANIELGATYYLVESLRWDYDKKQVLVFIHKLINRPKSTDTGASLSQGEQSTQRGSLNTHTDEGSESTIPTVRGNSPFDAIADVDGSKWPARAEHPVKAL